MSSFILYLFIIVVNYAHFMPLVIMHYVFFS